jgi:hypothetical protein
LRISFGDPVPADLPPHAARVVRAAVAMVNRRPSVPEAWREMIEAVRKD